MPITDLIVRTDEWMSDEQRETDPGFAQKPQSNAGVADRPCFCRAAPKLFSLQLSSTDLRSWNSQVFARGDLLRPWGAEEICFSTEHASMTWMVGSAIEILSRTESPVCCRLERMRISVKQRSRCLVGV